MQGTATTCLKCGRGFERFSKGSISITKYGGRKGGIFPEYKHMDLCSKCTKEVVKIDWKKAKNKTEGND